MSIPLISVVMSCLNEEQTLSRAIDSILKQSFTDFEFIIIDDGSTDRTKAIIKTYIEKDNRIRFIQNTKNIGLAAALNLGIKSSRAEFIARMDADDESHPERLEKQLEFISSQPDVDILGTAITTRTTEGICGRDRFCPEYHAQIIKLIFRKPLVYHPTILARKSVYTNHGMYNPKIKWAEDADLWYRIYDKVIFHNLPTPLLYYTVKNSLPFRNARNNFIVKLNNLKKRGLVYKYMPQLAYDSVVLGSRLISYRF